MDFLHELNEQGLKQWFFDDYAQCRRAFLHSVNLLGANEQNTRTWQLGESDLTTDAFWLGARDAKEVLVLISGTHGVEGYCGSAIQSFILQAIEGGRLTLQSHQALLVIHGLNSWGMQHARRCDQDGIDLNRNFVDFNHLPPSSEKYAQWIKVLDIPNLEQRQQALKQLELTWGRSEYEKVISGGQYTHAWAPFYGGTQASFASGVIDDVIDHWQLHERCLVVIDLHTGLGPWAFGELICDHDVDSNGSAFAYKLFGDAVALAQTGESFSVVKKGLLDYRWHELMHEQGCFLTLEFGTYNTDALFEVVLNDHLFWHHQTEPSEQQVAQQRQAMMHHFYPQDTLWRQAVLFKAWQVVARALSMGHIHESH